MRILVIQHVGFEGPGAIARWATERGHTIDTVLALTEEFPPPAHVDMQANFNRCLQLARGEYVKFLCADDVLEMACVERMLGVLADRPGVRLVACARRVFAA